MTARRWTLMLSGLGVAGLVGCASISYEPVKLDSPPPPVATTQDACPKLLSGPKPCAALVQANSWVSKTGIQVLPGQTYCLEVPANQVWFDKGRRNTPPKGEPGSGLMNIFPKRHDKAGFFSLMVNTLMAGDAALLHEHAVEHGASYHVRTAGELVFYPNDAQAGADDPAYFYKNNSGQIWVIVQRC